MGRAVGAVGYGAQYAEGNVVDITDLADCRSLHLAGDGAERVRDVGLSPGIGHKLIAGGDASGERWNLQRLCAVAKPGDERFVSGNLDDVDAGDEPHGIADGGCVCRFVPAQGVAEQGAVCFGVLGDSQGCRWRGVTP